jgi:hypothetical protein
VRYLKSIYCINRMGNFHSLNHKFSKIDFSFAELMLGISFTLTKKNDFKILRLVE